MALILKGTAERRLHDHRLQQGLVYSLATLMAYAMHEPRKMPKFDKVFPDGTPRRAQSADEIHDLMLGWVAQMEAADG